jgi:hypothetical protein
LASCAFGLNSVAPFRTCLLTICGNLPQASLSTSMMLSQSTPDETLKATEQEFSARRSNTTMRWVFPRRLLDRLARWRL